MISERKEQAKGSKPYSRILKIIIIIIIIIIIKLNIKSIES